MARTSRIVIPKLPHHIIQRGNDRQPIFRDDEDCQMFHGWMREASRQFNVAIHAYVLMGNHLQLLATPSDAQGLARMMQLLGRFYVPYFNRKYGRTGTLWQGRFKTSVIDSEQYFLSCSRYIEMVPVREGSVAHPGDYSWSSYLHHIGDKPDGLIADHPLYWALGNTPFEREAVYKQLMQQSTSSEEVDRLALALEKGQTLGSEQFQIQLEKKINRRVRPGKRGRPAKEATPARSRPASDADSE